MKNIWYSLVASLILISCYAPIENTTSPGGEIMETSFDGKHCFLETLPHKPFVGDAGDTIHFVDSTVIQLEIAGEKVTGIFNWMPAEKDQAHGTLEGTIKDDVIRVLYSYSIEGSEQQEEKIFQLRKDAIAIKTGELEEDDKGILRLKDESKAAFNEVILKVPCN